MNKGEIKILFNLVNTKKTLLIFASFDLLFICSDHSSPNCDGHSLSSHCRKGWACSILYQYMLANSQQLVIVAVVKFPSLMLFQNIVIFVSLLGSQPRLFFPFLHLQLPHLRRTLSSHYRNALSNRRTAVIVAVVIFPSLMLFQINVTFLWFFCFFWFFWFGFGGLWRKWWGRWQWR